MHYAIHTFSYTGHLRAALLYSLTPTTFRALGAEGQVLGAEGPAYDRFHRAARTVPSPAPAHMLPAPLPSISRRSRRAGTRTSGWGAALPAARSTTAAPLLPRRGALPGRPGTPRRSRRCCVPAISRGCVINGTEKPGCPGAELFYCYH